MKSISGKIVEKFILSHARYIENSILRKTGYCLKIKEK